jgi:hypothetical protein
VPNIIGSPLSFRANTASEFRDPWLMVLSKEWQQPCKKRIRALIDRDSLRRANRRNQNDFDSRSCHRLHRVCRDLVDANGVMRMHYFHVNDSRGELVDLIPFCCDSCHRQWCEANGEEYSGWNGCNEGSDSVEFCHNCGNVAGGSYQCKHQRDNVVVNRFTSTDGIKCKCGNWIQLPESTLAKI